MTNTAPATILTLILLFVSPVTVPSVAEEVVTEEVVTEEVVTEEAVTEEAVAEEAVTEEAVAEEAVTEETAGAVRDEANPRIEVHNRFLRLNDEERYEEAAIAAQQVVELTQNEFGTDAMQMVVPLTNLATTQMRNGDLLSAETNYKRCIRIIEEREDKLSMRLINPLNGLGATYNRTGLYEQGVSTFERALRINHVNEGFYNVDQFKIHDGLTESYIGLQDMEEANFFQEIQLEVYQRNFGPDNPAIAPGLYKLAEWYQRSGQIEPAFQAYRKADNIIRKEGGGDSDIGRVRALEGVAEVYEYTGNQSASASVLRKAIEVVDSQPEIDYERRGTLLVRLGDLYARVRKPNMADANYAEAWTDLSRDDDYLDLRDTFFANPVRLSGRKLSSLGYAPNARGKPAESLSDGYVLISYTVNAKGRAEKTQVVESDPPGMMDTALVSTFARSLFRPRRVDGAAVDSDRLLYQLDFLYSGEERRGDDGRADEPLEYPDAEDHEHASGDDRLEYPEKAAE